MVVDALISCGLGMVTAEFTTLVFWRLAWLANGMPCSAQPCGGVCAARSAFCLSDKLVAERVFPSWACLLASRL